MAKYNAYTVPLNKDGTRYVSANIPSDLTPDEASRVAAVLHALAHGDQYLRYAPPDVPESEDGAKTWEGRAYDEEGKCSGNHVGKTHIWSNSDTTFLCRGLDRTKKHPYTEI